jgi:hypothetical protein
MADAADFSSLIPVTGTGMREGEVAFESKVVAAA